MWLGFVRLEYGLYLGFDFGIVGNDFIGCCVSYCLVILDVVGGGFYICLFGIIGVV